MDIVSEPEPQKFEPKFINMRMKLFIFSTENVKPK